MKLSYDVHGLGGNYDRRNLTSSKTGKNHYPSKKMFIEFLKKFPDVKGSASIWSLEDHANSTVTINVEVKYDVPSMKKEKCFSCEKIMGYPDTITRTGRSKKENLRFVCRYCKLEADQEYDLEMKHKMQKLEKRK